MPSSRTLLRPVSSHTSFHLDHFSIDGRDGGGQARHRTVIQPGQCFAVGGCVRAAGKGLPVAQSPHPVDFRDAAEPIQGDKAAGHLAVKVGHGSPFGFLSCATMPAPSITPGRVIWPWTITATFSA